MAWVGPPKYQLTFYDTEIGEPDCVVVERDTRTIYGAFANGFGGMVYKLRDDVKEWVADMIQPLEFEVLPDASFEITFASESDRLLFCFRWDCEPKLNEREFDY